MTKIERLTAEILFLQERGRTSEDLARLLEVSRRTVLRDVRALVEMGVPILASDGPGGGYSLPRDATIPPLALTGKEAILLVLALDGLARLSDTPFAPERASLLAKLRAILPDRHRARVGALGGRVSLDVPARARRAPALDGLFEATESGLAVEFRYDGSEGARTVRARPSRLYAARGFWYLAAVEGGRGRTFRADRIGSLRTCSPEPDEPNEAVPYDHPAHPTVRVRLSARGARRVESEEHLGRLIGGAGAREIAFRCPPGELDWYARYFGGLGADAVVTGPPELANLIRKRAEEILELYGER